MSLRTLTAACHCKSINFTITILAELFPLKVHICHCSVCRRTHGTPCIFHAPLPDGVAPQFIVPSNMSMLTSYNHAESMGTRHFCSTCGCHVGDLGHDDGNWVISTAIFTEPNHNLWEMRSHTFTKSSSDGGLSAILSHIDGRQLDVFNPDLLTDNNNSEHGQKDAEAESKKLLAKCHCGGVSFSISRPRPDFIASPRSKGWILPQDPNKWLAVLDICDDCRLVDGSNVIAWMFVPTDHISPHPGDLIIGSSKSYKSSEGVLRTFCGTCGATVFYSCADRPGIVDVAVGILRAEGVMVEDWALWRTGRMTSAADGLKYDPAFGKALIEGFKLWGEQRGMPEDFILP